MHVAAAAGVRAVDNARLHDDEVQGIASAGSDDGQIFHGLLRNQVPEIAGGGRLHQFRRADDRDLIGNRAEFEVHVYGCGLSDGYYVVAGDEALETGGFHLNFIGCGLDGVEDIAARRGSGGCKSDAGGFVGEPDLRVRDGGAGGVFDGACEAGCSALGKGGGTEKEKQDGTGKPSEMHMEL